MSPKGPREVWERPPEIAEGARPRLVYVDEKAERDLGRLQACIRAVLPRLSEEAMTAWALQVGIEECIRRFDAIVLARSASAESAYPGTLRVPVSSSTMQDLVVLAARAGMHPDRLVRALIERHLTSGETRP